jgi:hypothetical protein
MESLKKGKQHKGVGSRSVEIAAWLAVFALLVLGAGAAEALAGQATLAWDANTEPTLAGYKLFYGTATATYGAPVDVGNVTTYTVTGLADGQTYYFALKAYDSLTNESGFSNEVIFTTPSLAEINLVGNAVSIPDGDTTPIAGDHTDFGSVDIAAGTVVRTFTVQNTGTQALTLSGTPKVAVSGANAADFTVSAQPTSPVAAAGSVTFQVTFDPSAAGVRSATLSIASNDANENPYDFAIQGTGTAAPEINLVGNAVSIPDGDTTPIAGDHTDFGSVDIAAGTIVRTFTIQNTGSGALTLSGSPKVAVSGANAADFTVSAQPTSPVAAAGSVTFQVTFDPSAAGVRSATLSIANDDASENPYDFAIQGTGASAPEINLVGNTVSIPDGDTTPIAGDHTDFGSVDIAAGTIVRTFTIQNTGSGALTLSGSPKVAVSGANAADFTVSAQPTSPVAAAGSVTFQVTFDPGAAGVRSATLSIANDDASENPYDFAIRGTGTAAAEIDVLGNAVSIPDGDTTPIAGDHTDFGSVDIAAGTIVRTFTIQNTGSGPLALSGTPKVAVSGANAADFTVSAQPTSPVAAAGSVTFQVTFDPSAAGVRSATLSIANDDASENPYDFAIQGTGTATPEINLVGNAVSIPDGDTTPIAGDHTDFGGAKVAGGTVVRTFTIQNTGSGALSLSGTPKVAVSGANAADFTVSAQPTTPVAAAGSVTFQVTFDPSAAGMRGATLSIASDDANENPYDFAIQGLGVPPPAAPGNVHVVP